jgi:hypothetical protein
MCSLSILIGIRLTFSNYSAKIKYLKLITKFNVKSLPWVEGFTGKGLLNLSAKLKC